MADSEGQGEHDAALARALSWEYDEEEEESDAEEDREAESRSMFELSSEVVLRLAVTLSLSVARAFLHLKTDKLLGKVAELAPEGVIKQKAQAAADRGLDLAGIAEELVRASGKALKDTGLSRPEFEMTGEAFTVCLRLATQFSGPTVNLSSDQLYDAAKAYSNIQKYAFWEDPRKSVRINDKAPVDELRRYVRFSMAVYGTLAMKFLGILSRVDTQIWSNTQAIEYLTGVSTEDNLVTCKWRANWVGSIYKPGHFVLLDHAHKEVILAVRGSYRFQDALTDLMCEDTEFSFHYHKQEDLENAQRELTEVFSSLTGAISGLSKDTKAGDVGSTIRDTTADIYHQLQDWVARQSRLITEELQGEQEGRSKEEVDAEGEDVDNDDDDVLDLGYGSEDGDEEDDGESNPRPRRTKYFTRNKTRAAEIDEQSKYPKQDVPHGHRRVNGRTHFGFLKAAQILAEELEDIVAETMRAHPGYQLIIVGHSLGSAVATLITLLWTHHPDLKDARCYGVAAPSCVSEEIAKSPIAKSRITSVVLADDIVPRLGLGTVSDLRNAIIYCAEAQAIGDKKNRLVVDYVNAVLARKPEPSPAKLQALFKPIMDEIIEKELVHDKLCPAGVVWHIPKLDGSFNTARRVEADGFGIIRLAPGMFDAHLPQRYAYACCDKLPLSEHDAEVERAREFREAAERAKRGSGRDGGVVRRLSRRLSRKSRK